MAGSWTFGRKLGVGFAVMSLVTLALAVVAILVLEHVIAVKDEVITKNARLMAEAQQLERTSVERMSNVRAFLLTGDGAARDAIRLMRGTFFELLKDMEARVADQEERQALTQLGVDATNQFDGGDSVVAMREKNLADVAQLGKAFQERVVPLATTLRRNLALFVELEQRRLEAATARAETVASNAVLLMAFVAAGGVVAAAVIAFLLARMLSRQIGSAVQHIQSSSSELQAAANQQTAGAKEQVASMTEISTTIKELMSTAKQIADSAQGVARIADNTTEAAEQGDQTVARAQSEVLGIRKQVDLVVEHMLDLGKKSQQIGASWRSSTNWPSRRTSWRSTPPSRPPGPARRASGSRSSPTRSASWPTASAARPRRSAA